MTFDPDFTGPRTLLDIVEGLGYMASLDEDGADDGSDPAAADKRYWLRKFCWSAAFSVPVFLLAMVRAFELLNGFGLWLGTYPSGKSAARALPFWCQRFCLR